MWGRWDAVWGIWDGYIPMSLMEGYYCLSGEPGPFCALRNKSLQRHPYTTLRQRMDLVNLIQCLLEDLNKVRKSIFPIPVCLKPKWSPLKKTPFSSDLILPHLRSPESELPEIWKQGNVWQCILYKEVHLPFPVWSRLQQICYQSMCFLHMPKAKTFRVYGM